VKHYYSKKIKPKPEFPQYLKEAEGKEYYKEYHKYIEDFIANMKNTRFEVISYKGGLAYDYIIKPIRFPEWLNGFVKATKENSQL
jgi:hypothetical protein